MPSEIVFDLSVLAKFCVITIFRAAISHFSLILVIRSLFPTSIISSVPASVRDSPSCFSLLWSSAVEFDLANSLLASVSPVAKAARSRLCALCEILRANVTAGGGVYLEATDEQTEWSSALGEAKPEVKMSSFSMLHAMLVAPKSSRYVRPELSEVGAG